MGGERDSSGERKSRAVSLISDYLQERSALREGPPFRTPPFVARRIEGTKTLYFAPADAGESAPRAPSRPPPLRSSFVRPDTAGLRRALPSTPPRPSAKDLIARLRVVREGVERSPGGGAETPGAGAPEGGDARAGTETGPREEGEKEVRAPPPPPAAPAGQPAQAVRVEGEGKSGGGRICPACGSPLSERNKLQICNSCGRTGCETCGRYELGHMKSDVFYEYKFDFPLCINCYEKAYSIQRLLGKASVCYGNGNYSYALYYANSALALDPGSRYAGRARELLDMISKAHEEAREREREWRLARKQLSTMHRPGAGKWG